MDCVAISASTHRLLRAMSTWTTAGLLRGEADPCESGAVTLRCGFYNIGWDPKNTQRGFRELSTEVCALVVRHLVPVLSLCEVFGIDDGRSEQYKIGERLAKELNQTHQWGGAWAYAACDHYITLWRTDLGFRCDEETGFHSRVEGRSCQKGHYLRFVHPDWPQPVHHVNHHNVSSRPRGLQTMEIRKTRL